MATNTNAKQELYRVLEINKLTLEDIKCAYLETLNNDFEKNFLCKLNLYYTDTDLEKFINSLDINYDSSWGTQELYGIIWLKDGTWLSRGEYDGSEWWIYNKCPEIPENLL